MCKDIDGVLYDTATSTVDKKFTYGVPGDSCGYEETLYITNDGRYRSEEHTSELQVT